MPKKKTVQAAERKKKLAEGTLTEEDLKKKKKRKRLPSVEPEMASVEPDFKSVGDKMKIEYIKIDDIHPNPSNPNVMDDKEFSALVQRIKKVGFRNNIQVRPITDPNDERFNPHRQQYEFIAGEHRTQAAKLLKMTEVPAVVDRNTDSQDVHDLNMLADNFLHGNPDAVKFTSIWQRLVPKYGEDMLKMSAGIVDQEVLDDILLDVQENFGDTEEEQSMKKEFKKKKKDIKTLEDLSRIINELYTKYGSTTEYSYMFFEHGGHTQLIVWMKTPLRHLVDEIVEFTRDNKLDINQIMERVITSGWDKTARSLILTDAKKKPEDQDEDEDAEDDDMFDTGEDDADEDDMEDLEDADEDEKPVKKKKKDKEKAKKKHNKLG